MGMEIERKWLPAKEWTEKLARKYKCCGIEQGYLCFDPVIRVRKDGLSCYMTYKGEGAMEHSEYNLPLNEKAYGNLLLKCEGRIIIKDRYRIPFAAEFPDSAMNDIHGPEGELLMELDVFHGSYEGLQILEVEFADRESAIRFSAPVLFGEEVTGRKQFTNACMAEKQ